MFLFNQKESMGSDIATLLRHPKYHGVDMALVLRAIEDRMEDYYQWCSKYECPTANVDQEETTYEYSKGYGRALELAREILLVVEGAFRGPRKPIYG